ncbi:MAG: four helix bundle protein [Verrucomicrobiota bacterium]|nr:four helix bundle protein [Verrucomicrobiota bacterium]
MSVEINSFRDLVVWQKAMKMVEMVYAITKQFPPDERYALTSQLRRASVSVPSNIAEGYGRHSTADYVRFLQIALGSLNELQTQLELGVRIGFVEKDAVKDTFGICAEIEKMLVALVLKLRSKIKR